MAIRCNFTAENTVAASFKVLNGTAELLISSQGSDIPVYGGKYEVTPAMEQQTLATKDKLLKKDIMIDKIPVYEVSNDAGGVTAVIGG